MQAVFAPIKTHSTRGIFVNKTQSKDDGKTTETAAAPAENQPKGKEQVQEQPQQQQQTIEIDDSQLVAGYANFCRVSSTPEELILDLGLNPNPYAQGKLTIKASQRIIMNHYTAKRLLHALNAALQRHEQAFGVLEIDVRKRIRTGNN